MNDYRAYRFGKREELLYGIAVFAGGLVLGEIFYDTPAGGIMAIPVYILMRKPVSTYLIKKRILQIRDQFRDILYSFSASFATGRHMTEAIKEAYPYICEVYGKEAIMAKELKNMAFLIESGGAGDMELWQDLADRSGLEDISDFAAVFKACRDTGGDLIGAVDRAAKVIGEKITIEADIRTMAAQRKMEGRLIGIMPIVMVLFLRMTSTGYMDVMYSTLAGRIVMSAALITMGGAIYLTEKITDIKV